MLVLTACQKTNIVLSTGFDEGEIFRIEGEKCYDREAYVYLSSTKNRYEDTFGEEIWSVSSGDIYISDNVGSEVLEKLAKVKMMSLLANSYNISLDKEEKEKAKMAAAEYCDALSKEEKSKMGGLKESDVTDMYRDYALSHKIYEYLTENVDMEISDDEARTVVLKQAVFLFDSDYSKEEVLKRAESFLDSYNAGETFEQLVTEYSDLPEETLYYRKGEMDPGLETSAFLMGTGEVSEILTGNDGYYILYCINPNDTTETEDNKARILANRKEEAFYKVYDSFVSDRKCYLNQLEWENIDFELTVNSGGDFFEIYNKYFE